MSPQIQGYVLGSPTQDIREVTVTQSGGKFYLDIIDPNLGPLQFLGDNQLIVDSIDTRELLNNIHDELKVIRKQLEFITDEKVSLMEVN